MPIIVKHKLSKKNYLLLGTGYGHYKATRPGSLGVLNPHEAEGKFERISVSNEKGEILWFDSSDFEVVEVDGVKIKNIFADHINDEVEDEENCPACQTIIYATTKECPSCGITLIDDM